MSHDAHEELRKLRKSAADLAMSVEDAMRQSEEGEVDGKSVASDLWALAGANSELAKLYAKSLRLHGNQADEVEDRAREIAISLIVDAGYDSSDSDHGGDPMGDTVQTLLMIAFMRQIDLMEVLEGFTKAIRPEQLIGNHKYDAGWPRDDSKGCIATVGEEVEDDEVCGQAERFHLATEYQSGGKYRIQRTLSRPLTISLGSVTRREVKIELTIGKLYRVLWMDNGRRHARSAYGKLVEYGEGGMSLSTPAGVQLIKADDLLGVWPNDNPEAGGLTVPGQYWVSDEGTTPRREFANLFLATGHRYKVTYQRPTDGETTALIGRYEREIGDQLSFRKDDGEFVKLHKHWVKDITDSVG